MQAQPRLAIGRLWVDADYDRANPCSSAANSTFGLSIFHSVDTIPTGR
ncbi:MAG: hypothetical protein QOH96_337 [Blastocatellia bacterium]|nr:hypothetical protein [Blastocatellia bacterium]